MEGRVSDRWITRDELIARLNAQGVEVTRNSLRHLHRLGAIPKAKRRNITGKRGGERALYPEEVVDTVRRVYATGQVRLNGSWGAPRPRCSQCGQVIPRQVRIKEA